MMSISSKAGQRLAKARYAAEEARFTPDYAELKQAFEDAAAVVADELIADKFHLIEGD